MYGDIAVEAHFPLVGIGECAFRQERRHIAVLFFIQINESILLLPKLKVNAKFFKVTFICQQFFAKG